MSVAGYLGYQKTSELRNVCEDKDVQKVVTEYSNYRNHAFGMPSRTGQSQIVDRLLWARLIDSQNSPEQVAEMKEILNGTPEDNKSRVAPKDRQPSYALEVTLTAIFHLMRVSELEQLDSGNPKKYYQYSMEHWGRAWALLRFIMNKFNKTPNMLFKANSSTIEYMSPSDATTEGSGPTGSSGPGGDSIAVAVAEFSAKDRQEMQETRLGIAKNLDEFAEQLISSKPGEEDSQAMFVKAMSSAWMNKANARIKRSKPSRELVEKFLNLHGRNVKVIFDKFSDPAMMPSAMVNMREDRPDEEETTDLPPEEAPVPEDDQANQAGSAEIEDDQVDQVSSEEIDPDVFELRRALTDVSSPYPTVFDAAKSLGYSDEDTSDLNFMVDQPPADLQNQMKSTKLTPLQVVTIAWMGSQHSGPLKGGVIALDCGAGKTISVLTHLHRLHVRTVKAAKSGETPDCRPTLIICPNEQVLTVWYDEWKGRFKHLLDCRIFYGAIQDAGDSIREKLTYPSLPDQALRRLIKECPSDDPNSTRFFFLTTYTTWQLRTLVVKPTQTVFKELHSTDKAHGKSSDPFPRRLEPTGSRPGGRDHLSRALY